MPATSAGAVQLDLKANTKNFLKQADAAAGLVKNKWNSLAGLLGGSLVFSGLAAFSAQAIKLASDLQEVQNVVDVTFPHMSEQVNEFAANAAQQFGLGGTTARQYVGRLGSMAEAMGFTEQQAYDMATAMAGLAGDVASFYNITSDEAYEKLTAIFTGQVRPLMSLGVIMNEAALDAFALANGYGKVTAEMTAAEKATLRLDYVQHALANATGDFARTSGSWANQIRLLTLNFSMFSSTIGQVLIAALLPAIRALNALMVAATSAARAVASLIELLTGKSMGELMGSVASGGVAMDGLADATTGLADAQTGAAGSAGKQAAAQKELNRTLAAFDRINKLTSQNDSGGGGGGGGGIGGLAGAFGTANEQAKSLASALDKFKPPTALTEALKRLGDQLQRFADIVGGAIQWAWKNILQPFLTWLGEKVLPPILDIMSSILSVINDLLEAIGPLVDAMWQNVFKPIADFIGDTFARGLQLIADDFKEFAAWIEENRPIIDEWIGNLCEGFEEMGRAIQDPVGYLGELWDAFLQFIGFGEKKKLNKAFTKTGEEMVKWMLTGVLDELPGFNAIIDSIFADHDEVEVDIEAQDRTARGRASAERSLAMIKPERMVSIFGLNRTQEGVNSSSKSLATLKDKSITVSATNAVSGGVKAANDYLTANFKSKTMELNAKNNVNSVVDAVNKKALNAKTTTLKAKDEATAKVNEVNNKRLNDKSAKLYFTPELTKKNIGMSVTGGGKNIALYTFAQGGFVGRNTPRLAVIGDNTREGEIVSPESKFQTMLDKAVAQGSSASTDALLRELISAVRAQDTTVILDGRSITRSVVNNINQQVQSTGRSPLII